MRARSSIILRKKVAVHAKQSKAREPDGATCSSFAASLLPRRRTSVSHLPPLQQQKCAPLRHAVVLCFFGALLFGTEATKLPVLQRVQLPYEYERGSVLIAGESRSVCCWPILSIVAFAWADPTPRQPEAAVATAYPAAAAAALPPGPSTASLPAATSSRVLPTVAAVGEPVAAAPPWTGAFSEASAVSATAARSRLSAPLPPAAATRTSPAAGALSTVLKAPSSYVAGTGVQMTAAAAALPAVAAGSPATAAAPLPTLGFLTGADSLFSAAAHGGLPEASTQEGDAFAKGAGHSGNTLLGYRSVTKAALRPRSSQTQQAGVPVRGLADRAAGAAAKERKEDAVSPLRQERHAPSRRLLPWFFHQRLRADEGQAPVPVAHASAGAASSLPFLSAYTYKEVLHELQELQARFPHLLRIYNWADDVGLSPYMQHHDCQEGLRCEIPLVELTNFSAKTTATPTLFFSGAVHGDERAGPTAAVELLRYLCERYDTESEVYYLVNNRRLLVMPFPNAIGFAWRLRQEISVDVNRDFPYDQQPQKCFRSVASKAINEVFRRNVVLAGISWHGGMRAIAYPWGSYNHAVQTGTTHWISRASPDQTPFLALAQAMQATGGHLPGSNEWYYPIGDMTTLVYPVHGGMEDWAYGIGFETSPSPIPVCTPSQGFLAEPVSLRHRGVAQKSPATRERRTSPRLQGASRPAAGQQRRTMQTRLRKRAGELLPKVGPAEEHDGQQAVPQAWRAAVDDLSEELMELDETEAAGGRPARLALAAGDDQEQQQEDEESDFVVSGEEDADDDDSGDEVEELKHSDKNDAAAGEKALGAEEERAGDSWVETAVDEYRNAGHKGRPAKSTGKVNSVRPPTLQVVEDVKLAAAKETETSGTHQTSDTVSTSAGSDLDVDVRRGGDETASSSADSSDYPFDRSLYGSGDGRTLLVLLEMHDDKHPLPEVLGPRPVDVPGLLLPEEKAAHSFTDVLGGEWGGAQTSEKSDRQGESLILRNVRAALKLVEKVSPDLLFTSVPPMYQPQGAVSLVGFYPVGCQTLSFAQLQIRRGSCSLFFVKRPVETKPIPSGGGPSMPKRTAPGGKLPRRLAAGVEGTGAAAAQGAGQERKEGWKGAEEVKEEEDAMVPDLEEYELRREEWERAPLLLQEAAKEVPARCREMGEWERLRGGNAPIDVPPEANEWWGEGGNKDIELNKGSLEERRGRVEIQFKIPPDAANGEYCSVVFATFDQGWKRQTNADPNTSPQAHLARLRLEDNYEAHSSEGRSVIRGRRFWSFPTSVPALYPVVFSPGLPLHVRDDNVEGSAEVQLLLPTALDLDGADGLTGPHGTRPSHVAVDVFLHLGGNFSEKRLRVDPFAGVPRFIGDTNIRMTIDRTDISVRLSHPHFMLADGWLEIRVLEEGNLAGHAFRQLLSTAAIAAPFSAHVLGHANVGKDRQVKTLLLAEFPTGSGASEALQRRTHQQKVQRLKQRYEWRRAASLWNDEGPSDGDPAPATVSYLDPQTLHGVAATAITTLLGRVVHVQWFRQIREVSAVDQHGRSLQTEATPHVGASTVVWSSLFTPSIRQFVYEQIPPLSSPPRTPGTADKQKKAIAAGAAQYVASLLCLFTTDRSASVTSADAPAAVQGAAGYLPRQVERSAGAAEVLKSAVGYLKMMFFFPPLTDHQHAPRQQRPNPHQRSSRETLLLQKGGGYTVVEAELCGVDMQTDVDATCEKLYVRFDSNCCPVLELHAVADEGGQHGHAKAAAQHEKVNSTWWPDFLVKGRMRRESQVGGLPETDEGGRGGLLSRFYGKSTRVSEASSGGAATPRQQEWKPKKWKLQERDRLKMLTSCSCGPGTVVTVSASKEPPATKRDPHRFAQSPFYNAAYVLPSPDTLDARGFRTLSCALSVIPAPGATIASPVLTSTFAGEGATTGGWNGVADTHVGSGGPARVAGASPGAAAGGGSRTGSSEHAQARQGDSLAASSSPSSASTAAAGGGAALLESATFLSGLVCGNRHHLSWREWRGVREVELAKRAALSQASARPAWRTFQVGESARSAEQEHPIAAKAAAESAAYVETHEVARAHRGVDSRNRAGTEGPDEEVPEIVQYLEAAKQDDMGDESHSQLQPELYALVLVLLLVGVCVISPCLVSLRYCLRTSPERRALAGSAELAALGANSSDEEEEQSSRPAFRHEPGHRDSFDEETHSRRAQQEADDSETVLKEEGEQREHSGFGWREGVEVRSSSSSGPRLQAGKGRSSPPVGRERGGSAAESNADELFEVEEKD